MPRRLPATVMEDACAQPSRRGILQGGAGSPLLLALPTHLDPAAAEGAAWLARHVESQRLSLAWSELEGRLIRERDWLNLTRLQRNRFTEAFELDALSDRMDDLDRENEAAIASLVALQAISPAGIERKLEVTLAFLPSEENPDGHGLIASILHDYRALTTG